MAKIRNATEADIKAIKTSIKSVNQRIRRLARKYGTEDIEYKRYISDIDRNFGIHYTKEGIIQINTPKMSIVQHDDMDRLSGISPYQVGILKKVKGRKGIKGLEEAAKKRLQDEGIAKPTRAEIEKEVKQFSSRQSKIDSLLDTIYIEEGEGSLPVDIANVYSKIHRHGKGAGSGVSNADIDYLIDGMERWQAAKQKLMDLSRELQELGLDTDYTDNEIWAATSGRYTLTHIEEQLIPELEGIISRYYS